MTQPKQHREVWIWNVEYKYDGPFMFEPEHTPIPSQEHYIEYAAYEEAIAARNSHYEDLKKWGVAYAEAFARIAELEKALQEILHAGNSATLGKWDATNEMKNMAYKALERKGDEG